MHINFDGPKQKNRTSGDNTRGQLVGVVDYMNQLPEGEKAGVIKL